VLAALLFRLLALVTFLLYAVTTALGIATQLCKFPLCLVDRQAAPVSSVRTGQVFRRFTPSAFR
jgi:hypothetical protein